MNPATDWIEQARRVLDALRAGGPAAPAESHSGDCRWCPVCQVAAVVRGERPELTAALADVLTATATALRTFAEAAHPDPPAEPDPAPEEGVDAPPAVQRIDIA